MTAFRKGVLLLASTAGVHGVAPPVAPPIHPPTVSIASAGVVQAPGQLAATGAKSTALQVQNLRGHRVFDLPGRVQGVPAAANAQFDAAEAPPSVNGASLGRSGLPGTSREAAPEGIAALPQKASLLALMLAAVAAAAYGMRAAISKASAGKWQRDATAGMLQMVSVEGAEAAPGGTGELQPDLCLGAVAETIQDLPLAAPPRVALAASLPVTAKGGRPVHLSTSGPGFCGVSDESFGLPRAAKTGVVRKAQKAEGYDVFPAENVTGEKDACGVGMMANMQKPAGHELLEAGLRALRCMEHRGACSSGMDANIAVCGGDDSGDGAGVMTQIPWELLASEVQIPKDHSHTAVGMLFLAKDPEKRIEAKAILEKCLMKENFEVLGYRIVPVDPSVLGYNSSQTEPWTEQIVVSHPKAKGAELESLLYIARKRTEAQLTYDSLYVCSFSPKTIVYKGMLKSSALSAYYKDLHDPRYKCQYCLWHRRFSTNTMPRWPLAQPFRAIGHNGEINTIQGNYNWTHARSSSFEHPNFGYRMEQVLPPCRAENSDSGNLDCYVELMLRCNRELPEALMIMVPEAYDKKGGEGTRDDVKEFYEYWGALQEPWDGPALLAFCDGEYMGAALDRNGLRPARYFQLHDGTTVVSSEAGILDEEKVPTTQFKSKGRLGPGKMVAIDLHTGELIENDSIKQKMAAKKPYHDWNETFRESLADPGFLGSDHDDAVAKSVEENLIRLEFDLGYTIEDTEMVVEAMAIAGREPTFCMGNDKPLAVVSERPHVLYDYFTQRFAQVTNPAIDPYREALVMQVGVHLGRQGNLMAESPTYFQNQATNNRLLHLESPFMHERELDAVRMSGLLTVELSTRYEYQEGPDVLEKRVSELCYLASNSVRNGAELLILSDLPASSQDSREKKEVSDEGQLAIPPLLAVAAVHHYLIKQGLRTQVSLIVNTGQCWSTHHFACLVGYGASAVCPYLALAHIRKWHASKAGQAKSDGQTVQECQDNFRKSIIGGLKKIMSKIGISVLESYRGAQIFQCIGIDSSVVDMAFTGTPTSMGALGFKDIANESMLFHRKAYPEIEEGEGKTKLDFAGWYKYMKKSGEFHMNNPEMARALHKAVRNNAPMSYEEYRRQIMDGRPVTAIRDLLDFTSDRQPIPVGEVEDALSICNRFVTGGMSLGALSRESHEIIALGMNRVGGKSNSGEGGEDKLRFKTIEDVDETGHSPSFPHLQGLRNGDCATSKTKQIASGRFGVTPDYLTSAEQLEIKLAQGAKPGEGGQLPGPKVDTYIASLRNSVPGVELISPPPHHDIYSIEDLAQLIFDLHQISPEAKVSVKLVASAGIGTIAAGVAKANADVIQISGHDGGTGASPLSSIMHAGAPWEQGLSEVQDVLVTNGLRDRVTLRVDGGLKSGWDIVMGALMGAEEYGFGSIVMIAEGCIMARVCHKNTCPVGVATQVERLRKKFPGQPEHVANFMLFLAEEVRTIMAALGYRSLDEIIGRRDLIRPRGESSVRSNVPQPAVASVAQKDQTPFRLSKTDFVDLSMFYATERPSEEIRAKWVGCARNNTAHENGPVLDDEIVNDPDVLSFLEKNDGELEKSWPITNVDRSVGGRMSGVIARRYGDYGFNGKLNLKFTGSTGQSFGVWNIQGVNLTVVGECNDYVGKGMAGGSIVAHPPADSTFKAHESVIAGNTCLYGATGGEVYLSGKAGERYGVRNAGCRSVIEGSGDHLGEYMTNGIIVAIGGIGRNVGAGMSGGLIYVYDPDGEGLRMHGDNAKNVFRVVTEAGQQQLQELIKRHLELTGSERAAEILNDWANKVQLFWQVAPASVQSQDVVDTSAGDVSDSEMVSAKVAA